MKLRNKKTRETVDFASVNREYDGANDIGLVEIGHERGETTPLYSYNSLSELNEEWEDASEEPKEYWYINEYGTVMKADNYGRDNIYDRSRKNFGNHFETREEAKKAVEKLEAWKRLKDKGCRFVLDDYFAVKLVGPDVTKIKSSEEQKSLTDDYKLLFGGEE